MCRNILNLPTPIDRINPFGYDVYIKRDDLMSREFSGNKGRKFYALLNSDLEDIDTIISYGSNQSNAMYSLSVLAKIKNKKFIYYIDHLPKYLIDNPVGNYKGALDNGAEFIIGEKPNLDEFDNKTLFVDEGGRESFAKQGIYILAKEIEEWLSSSQKEDLDIFLPSGTGTTALYLSNYFVDRDDIRVWTTPCVGNREYLIEQFRLLESDSRYYPKILDLDKKYHFGKLYREFYEIWLKLQQSSSIVFDMLYDPKGWLVLDNYREKFGKNILYIHQGGLLGNESMLPRYQRKYERE